MKYNLLALSIMTLGVAGCASQPVHQSQNLPLNQKVYHSYEKLVSKESYAFDGKMTFQVEPVIKTRQTEQNIFAEPSKRQQILQQVLQQQTQVKSEQQKWMQDGIAQPATKGGSNKGEKIDKFLQTFLNRYYYAFDGVVDLKQGQISVNPKIGYAAHNAQGWIMVPLALDLRQAKAYADISALSPIFTDPKYDGQYVVFDFQELLRKADVNVKPALELMRESLLVSAALARETDYKKLPLTAEDRQRGGVERIHYQGRYDELLAQYFLYFYLNEAYLKNILPDKDTKSKLDGLNPMDLALGTENQLKQPGDYGDAAKDNEREALYRLLDAIDDLNAQHDASDNGADVAEDAAVLEEEIVQLADRVADEDEAEAYLKEIDVRLAASQQQKDQREQTLAKFASYKSDKLVSAQRMQQIVTEQPQAYQDLIQLVSGQFKELDFLLEGHYQSALVLDAKGRLVHTEMDFQFNGFKELGIQKLSSKAVMNIHNYGTAKVDKSKLNNAISFKQAANENTLLNLGKTLDKYTGVDLNKLEDKTSGKNESQSWSRTERYNKIAEDLVKQNLSFLESYAILYRYAYIVEGTDLEYEEFNLKDLDDTARWTAIYYADEFKLPLTAKEKAEYENSPEEWYYYDDYIAETVWNAISTQQQHQQLNRQFNQLRKQGKTDAQIFSQIYLSIETEQEKRSTGEDQVKFDQRFLDYVNVLGEVAIEDVKTRKINTDQLKQFSAYERDWVNSDIYKQVYKLFLQ